VLQALSKQLGISYHANLKPEEIDLTFIARRP